MIRRYPNIKTKRQFKTRAKLKKANWRVSHPRLSVFRSAKYIYCQIIDDKKGITLASASEKDLKLTKDKAKPVSKVDKAYQVGQVLAQKAAKKKIKQVFFDRGRFRFHGRVASLAKGAREGGLSF